MLCHHVDVWLVAPVCLLVNCSCCHGHQEVSADCLHKDLTTMQGQWLVFGGFPVPAEDVMTKMFAFDFSTLSWSLLDLTGTPLQHRMSYLAACHDDSLILVGGTCLSLLLHYTCVNEPCFVICLAVTPAR